MIISRTPVRVSFCGGGTDLDWFANSEENGGRVTSLALNRYIHVTVNARFDDMVRVSYSKMELVDNFEEIEHELVREAMRMTGVTSGVEITTIADIPSRGTGLGSSSTVTVGLLNALHNFAGREVSARQLAEEACKIEIDILGQPIGGKTSTQRLLAVSIRFHLGLMEWSLSRSIWKMMFSSDLNQNSRLSSLA